jgi:hypothetical protein
MLRYLHVQAVPVLYNFARAKMKFKKVSFFDVQMPGLPAYGDINRPFGSILVNDENFTYIVVVGGQSWLTGANRNIHQNPCVSVQLVASLDGNSLLVKLHSVR